MKTSFVSNGRTAVYAPDNPGANNRGYMLRSRYVMEQHLGRLLQSHEVVHHKNRDKQDDRLENLELLSKQEHASEHWEEKLAGQMRRLDYDKIRELMLCGMGYKKIAKEIDRPVYSVKSACRIIKRGRK